MAIEDDKVFEVFKWSLGFIGVRPFAKEQSKTKEHLLYSYQILVTIQIITAIVLEIAYIIKHNDDMSLMTEAAGHLSISLMMSHKISAYIIFVNDIGDISKGFIINDYAMNLPIVAYAFDDKSEGKLLNLKRYVEKSMNDLVKKWKFSFVLYFVMSTSTVILFLLIPFWLMYYDPDTYKRILPFPMALPWDETKHGYYEVSYSYHIFIGLTCPPIFCSLDMLLGFLVMHILRQMKLLGFIFVNMSGIAAEVNDAGSEQWEHDCIIILSNCAKHFNNLKHVCGRLNTINRPFFLVQAVIGSIALCLCMFRIASLPPLDPEAYSYYSLASTIIIQVAITNWLGQQLINEADNLEQAVLEDWYTHSIRYRKLVAIFHAMVQKPIVMYIWGSTELSLCTFSAIVRTAFSYLALLKTVTEE